MIIIDAFDLYAATHFDKIDNYEALFEALIQVISIRNGGISLTAPFLNLNLRYNQIDLMCYTLILALCLDKETIKIELYID